MLLATDALRLLYRLKPMELAPKWIAMCCLAGILPSAHAGDVVQPPRWYVLADIGPAFIEDIPVKLGGIPPFEVRVKSRLRLDTDFGYRFTQYVSTELELGYINGKLEDFGQHDFIQIPV